MQGLHNYCCRQRSGCSDVSSSSNSSSSVLSAESELRRERTDAIELRRDLCEKIEARRSCPNHELAKESVNPRRGILRRVRFFIGLRWLRPSSSLVLQFLKMSSTSALRNT
mmetsp:Transcript_789/g.1309  ORF Transcript_789/g.1309 Transcript_789/m.1309 type:complete len:111 (+) Transcript_789:49-381(+)